MKNQYFKIKAGVSNITSSDGNYSFKVKVSNILEAFIMTVNSGTNSQFMVPTQGIGYDYKVTTSDGQIFTGLTSNKTITFPDANTDYDIFITGTFPRIYFNNSTLNSVRLKEIKQWGNQKWSSMQGAFTYCQNMIGTYTDMPDLSNVANMSRMFEDAITFNQDISSWDVSNVTNMNSMLQGTTAMTEDLDWSDPITGSINVLDITNFALNSALTSIKLQAGAVTSTHYAFRSAFSLTELILIDMSVDFDISDTALTGAAIDALADSVLDMTGQTSPTITMTQAQLDSCDHDKWLDKNWATVPATQTQPGTIPFIMKVNSGSNSNFTIPTAGGGYNYTITTSDSQTFTGVTGNRTINFPSANTDYDISITGTFPRIYFNNVSDSLKLKEIKQWGNIEWSSMYRAFYGCSNMTMTATDAPDLSNVTNMAQMFHTASAFNQDISTWDTSNVIDMSGMFHNALTFNQDISTWNTSNVTDMNAMFDNAQAFNQPLNNWDVSNVTDMFYMFYNAITFNQPLNLWNTSNVTNMNSMFESATVFNQNISGWNVANVTSRANFRDYSALTAQNAPNF